VYVKRGIDCGSYVDFFDLTFVLSIREEFGFARHGRHREYSHYNKIAKLEIIS